MTSEIGEDRVEMHILRATEQAGKTYEFRDRHDPGQPADFWFQHSHEGLVLFVVFYTQACRWSLCTACNLPSVVARRHIGYRLIMQQIDCLLSDPAVVACKSEIAKLIVSNNGSVLDEETFPSTAMMYLMTQINVQLPALRTVSLETRVEYVDMEELEFLSRAMKEREIKANMELAVGFEAFDDHIRNQVFLKGLTLQAFETLVSRMTQPHLRLKCYFMQKPVPGMSDEEAVEDVRCGIEYLSALAKRYPVPINMHLNPTYVARGTSLEVAFYEGRYQPPLLADVATAVLRGEGKGVSIFVGLSDEGLAVEGGSFIREAEAPLVEALEAFNRTQNFAALRKQIERIDTR